MGTLFRFITVRNPRKPSQAELSTGFVNFDPRLDAPLIRRVQAMKRNQADTEAICAVIQEYLESDEYIGDPGDVETRLAGFVTWADWLADRASGFDKEKWNHLMSNGPSPPEPHLQGWLWDNLLAHVYGGGKPETREVVIWLLRLINMLLPKADDVDEPTVKRLAFATVVLPSDVHLSRGHEEPEPELAPQQPDLPGDAGGAYLEELGTAHEEITHYYGGVLDQARGARVPLPWVPEIKDCHFEEPPQSASKKKDKEPVLLEDFFTIGPQAMAQFTEPTRKILAALGVVTGNQFSYALKKIEETAATVGKKSWSHNRAAVRISQAGGAFWVYDPQPRERPPFIPVWGCRKDRPYSDFSDDEKCLIKPLGIADFRRVEQRLLCYEPGEVAHIENVLKGESKERETRHLQRREEFISTAFEEETLQERETEKSDRFEMEREVSKVVETDLSFELGVQVTANYGPVRIQADTNFALNHSTSESDKTATNYAREITENALERVVKKTRELRTVKLIDEFEEKNKHALNNDSSEHIVGLYRWVDKVYEARVVNYGKRLMFEFMIPEPAAFHLHVMARSPIENSLPLEKPIDPRSDETISALRLTPIRSHQDINATNFGLWAAAYDARVDPVPPEFVTIGKAYSRDSMDHNTQFSDSKNDLKLPEGYEGNWFNTVYGLHSENHSGGPNWISLVVGRRSIFATSGGAFGGPLDGEDDFVPITIVGRTRFYALAIEILCRRTPTTYENWQIKTFNAIIKGFQDKMAAYQNALAEAKARVGIEIQGTNPARNREIEKMELKKAAIRLMAQKCAPLASEAMKEDGDCGYPEFNCCEAIRDGSYVQFVEQAFEWKLITYLFYPYFWGRKCNWRKIYQIDDVDPLFLGFLQAGYARVVVPVREGYQAAVMRFLADGVPWNGGSAPGIDSPMYLAIENELKEPVGEIDPNVEPWEIRLPTTLTVLQCESGCVAGSGLPCPREEPRD